MDILKKIFLIVFFAIVLLFVGLSIFIHNNGKNLIEEKFSAVLKKEVHVGEARVLFPLGLRFNNVEIKDALHAKVLRVQFGLPLFFGGQFNIAKVRLTDPEFLITRGMDKKIIWGKIAIPAASPQGAEVSAEAVPASQESAGNKSPQGILIDYLEVDNGRVKFIDQPHSSEIDIGQINLKARMIPVPQKNLNTTFDLDALVTSDNMPFAGRKIDSRGMVNMVARDMDASIKMLDPDGNAGISAYLKSVNNDLLVKGKINIGRFMSEVKTKDSKESTFEGFLTSALESSGVEIGLDFTCQTKMDDFNCDKISMSGKVVQHDKKP